MGRKRHTAEQIIAKLREAEIDTAYRCIDTLDGVQTGSVRPRPVLYPRMEFSLTTGAASQKCRHGCMAMRKYASVW